jgi:hypothetical protein
MRRFCAEGWVLDYDRDATAAAYRLVREDPGLSCGCAPCLNWSRTRDRLLPTRFRTILDEFGVAHDREAELYHTVRTEAGHLCGGWYHLVGHLIAVPQAAPATISIDAFHISFSRRNDLVAAPLQGHPLVQLDFHCTVPWLSDVPEPAIDFWSGR